MLACLVCFGTAIAAEPADTVQPIILYYFPYAPELGHNWQLKFGVSYFFN